MLSLDLLNCRLVLLHNLTGPGYLNCPQRGSEFVRPSRSPNLNPLDFSVLSNFKDLVYQEEVNSERADIRNALIVVFWSRPWF
ncbi:hypothetical protein NQ318_002917 [Aromia moschata]|uniref:Uncharacterized protein n=1 Tax=Aromia moschata TaxID=1265417 RepID=A0AAV8Y549_9CUCU|nr:hypothetical protein NQ318_002917 [Aromia moschata]